MLQINFEVSDYSIDEGSATLSSPIILQFRENQNNFTIMLTPVTVATAEADGVGDFINADAIAADSRATGNANLDFVCTVCECVHARARVCVLFKKERVKNEGFGKAFVSVTQHTTPHHASRTTPNPEPRTSPTRTATNSTTRTATTRGVANFRARALARTRRKICSMRRGFCTLVLFIGSVCVSGHISPMERMFVLKTLSRSQRATRAGEGEKFVGICLKRLRSRVKLLQINL